MTPQWWENVRCHQMWKRGFVSTLLTSPLDTAPAWLDITSTAEDQGSNEHETAPWPLPELLPSLVITRGGGDAAAGWWTLDRDASCAHTLDRDIAWDCSLGLGPPLTRISRLNMR